MKPIEMPTGSTCVESCREGGADVCRELESHLHIHLLRVFLALLALFLLVAARTQGSEADSRHPGAKSPDPAPTLRLQEQAAVLEQAGRKKEAAERYEAITRTNALARKVLSHRLVTIYADTRETNKALKWAREVMRANPDQQAYVAGIHVRLGDFKQAQVILAREIAANTNETRAVTLRWQLAEVCQAQGETTQATKLNQEALSFAKGSVLEEAAHRRLTRNSPPPDQTQHHF